MEIDLSVLPSLFVEALAYWWVIIPATVLGIVVGAIPGFSAATTIIILLPLTLSMSAEAGMIFMVAIYTASRLGAGIPAILVNIPGTAGAAATPLDGYPMSIPGRGQQSTGDIFYSLGVWWIAHNADGVDSDSLAFTSGVSSAQRGNDCSDAVWHIADCHHLCRRHNEGG